MVHVFFLHRKFNGATLLRIEVVADNLRFITNVGQAKIAEIKIENFEALSTSGRMEAILVSESDFPSEFELSLHCEDGV
jgi:hypothetical protein